MPHPKIVYNLFQNNDEFERINPREYTVEKESDFIYCCYASVFKDSHEGETFTVSDPRVKDNKLWYEITVVDVRDGEFAKLELEEHCQSEKVKEQLER